MDYEPFIGEAEQTLDSINRVIIPASFRDNLRSDFYLCKGINEPCVWILPNQVFKNMLKKSREKISITNKDHQRWIGRITASAVKKSLDAQNRLSIPPALLQHAGLKSKDKIKIIGHDERAEIWALDRWNEVENIDFFELSKEIDEEYSITGYCEE